MIFSNSIFDLFYTNFENNTENILLAKKTKILGSLNSLIIEQDYENSLLIVNFKLQSEKVLNTAEFKNGLLQF